MLHYWTIVSPQLSMNLVRLLAATLTVFSVTSTLTAQGTVNFANAGGGVNFPFFDIDGTTRLAGPEYMAQLFAGASADSLAPVGAPTTFLTGDGAGYFNGGVIAIPTVAPGATGFFQVCVWQTLGGTITSYTAALAARVNTGQSTIFSTATGGVGSPPSPPSALVGLGAFQLVPEPSTYALLALGAAALLFHRRSSS
jgi:hypothetical protein